MNVAQIIGQLYDPDCSMKIYYDGWHAKTPRLNFTLCADRPKSNGGSSLSYVGCTIGGEPALWFRGHVSHGDVVALDGFLDSRVVRFAGGKKEKVEVRLVVTHLNWVGKRKAQELVAGTEKINLGDVGVEKAEKDPTKSMTVVEVPEDDDDGQYDSLPDWEGGLYK